MVLRIMFWLVVICCLVFNIRATDSFISGLDDSSKLQQKFKELILEDLPSQMPCAQQNLLLEVSRVYENQNEPQIGGAAFRDDIVVILFQDSTWNLAVEFEERVLSFKPGTQLLYWYVRNSTRLDEGLKTTLINLRELTEINSLVVFSENAALVTGLIEFVSTDTQFMWTNLRHTTEWIIGSSSDICDVMNMIQSRKSVADFITLVFITNCYSALIAQKSRTDGLGIISHHVIKQCRSYNKFSRLRTGRILSTMMNKSGEEMNVHNIDKCLYTADASETLNIKYNVGTGKSRFPRILKLKRQSKLRPNALVYLNSKKSVMDGLHIPAAILPVDAREAFQKQIGNKTYYSGVAIVLLNALAVYLGFTYDLVWVEDKGFYGSVNEDGTATGVTGQLQRREAALTTITLSWLQSRYQVMDFVTVPTIPDDPISIVYRLPSGDKNLDTMFIDIIKPDLVLFLLGPLLGLAAIGAIVHLLTKSCTLIWPHKVSGRDVRRLHSCPDHVCFHSGSPYAPQTGRILRASWGVFCIILGAAYSARLVTTFTLKPKELSIQTFQDLLNHPDFKFGMPLTHTALITEIKTSKDKALQDIWKKLEEFNKTDPDTFTSNFTLKIKRVLAGNYALIDSININRMSELVPADYSDVRCYPQKMLDSLTYSYVGIPKHTFYKDAIYKSLLDLEGAGILHILRISYGTGGVQRGKDGSSGSNVVNDEVQDHTAVSFAKILLLVYVTAAGVGVGFLTLVLEMFVKRCNRFSATFKVS